MEAYEKLGAFYLGRVVDPDTGETRPEPLLYDAKDLTTHAVCVGMTGSGKTGLCLGLLEEAALDGIPVLAIDPKGDLGNLLLTFPELRPQDFEPWVDPGEALRKGVEPAAFARQTAQLWQRGLKEWSQDGERIARLRAAADFAIYTPGSTSGLPLTVLRSFSAPPPALVADVEALGERVMGAVSGLLAMLGRDTDPIQSRDHILLSTIVTRAWQEGRDLGLGDLIREVQSPPFSKVGFFDLESFYPSSERNAFALVINNLIASPGFAAWTQGEPLDIARLLWTPEGKPRVAVLSIAHLSEAQRMFFVTVLLNELVAWMRTQSGTTSLRALLYMDEVFGYFPPTANPPSKQPMLTLLKQARAYGLGCVLATQNPVDLDYKGLSNTGTWFLGRLQTERDKARVLEGLEGASATTGAPFDRARMEATLAGLESRTFLMNNVHDDHPVLFRTRWVMSYLRGPLTREQIARLMSGRVAEAAAPPPERAAAAPPVEPAVAPAPERPLLPPEVREGVLPLAGSVAAGDELVYRPALLGGARLHYVNARHGVDLWTEVWRLAPVDAEGGDPWDAAEPLPDQEPALDEQVDSRGRFGELPAAARKKTSYTAWGRDLRDHLYRSETLSTFRCKALKAYSEPGESEREFRGRVAHLAREKRDLAVEKLRKRYTPKLKRLADRIDAAQVRAEREQEQYEQHRLSTVVSVGATVLGALFGRKVTSAGNVGRAASTVRRAGRTAQERGDIARAQEKIETLREQLEELEAEFEEETARVQEDHDPDAIEIEEKPLRPRKSDIDVGRLTLVWAPWRIRDGRAEALYR